MKKLILVILILQSFLFAIWMDVGELPSASNHKSPKALSVVEARQSIGYSLQLAENPKYVMRAKIPIVIIDAGFVGIEEYLKKHPKKKKNILGWVSFYKKGKKVTASHGLKVYKSAMVDSPDSKYYLLQVDLSDRDSLKKAVAYMAKHKLNLANFSIGVLTFLGENAPYDDTLHRFLDKYQITLFQSSGNDRRKAHYFKYSDVNKNGFLEFIDVSNKDAKKYEYNAVGMYKDKPIQIKLRWHLKDDNDVKNNIEVRLIDKNRQILASVKKSTYDRLLYLKHTPQRDQKAYIQILDNGIKVPSEKYFSLHVQGAYTKYKSSRFNGFSIVTKISQKDSPFIINVGSYGRGDDGKLVPSSFSSYAKTIDGKVLPHIMGPGQLEIDGKKISGTSFSAPFISAFYAKFTGYNIKNIVESTSYKDAFSSSVLPIEKSRWGVPNVMQLSKSYCFSSDKIKNLTHKITEKSIVFNFDFSRKCMEGLDYRIELSFLNKKMNDQGIQKSVFIKYKNAKTKLFYSNQFKSKTKNIENQNIEIKVPLKDIKDDIEGTKTSIFLSLRTRNTQEPVSISANLNYSFLLPLDKQEYIDLEGDDAINRGMQYLTMGFTSEALYLFEKGEKASELSKDPDSLVKVYLIKSILLMRLNRYEEAFRLLEKIEATDTTRTIDIPLMYKAVIYYAFRDYNNVLEVVKKLNKLGIYDEDVALLEYFSNMWLNHPKPFVTQQSELSQLLGNYLNNKVDYITFYNALAKLELEQPKEYARMLPTFITLQQSFIKGEKRGVVSNVKRILNMGYIDSPYFIITKAQVGKVKIKKLKTKPTQKIQKSKRPTSKTTTPYPNSPSELAETVCRAFKDMDWESAYRFTAKDLHNYMKKSIDELEENPEEFKRNISEETCKIEDSQKKSDGTIRYEFYIFNSMSVNLIDGNWKVTEF